MSHDRGSYNSSGFKIFAFSMLFSLCFFIYVGFLHESIDLKEVPEEVVTTDPTQPGETTALPEVDVSDVTNPWVESGDMIARGQKVFKQACALCHGDMGMGDGVAGRSLPEKPRDFVEGKWKSEGTAEALYKIIKDGQGQFMASFSHLPKNDRWALVHYIRSITKNKVEDDPTQLEAFGQRAE